jgi:hypothetical protein
MNHLDLKTLFFGFILGAGAILALGAASETERVGRYQVLTTSAGDVCQVITLDTVSGKAEVRGVHFQNKEPYVSGMKTFSFSK